MLHFSIIAHQRTLVGAVLVERGALAEVGAQTHLDIERVLALGPDVVLNYWSVADHFKRALSSSRTASTGIGGRS
jgi:ABC-type Fe3+-hydroxamate transport system substrate-binding protein